MRRLSTTSSPQVGRIFDEIHSVVLVSLLPFHLSDQEFVLLTDQGLIHLTAGCYFPSHMEENFTMMEVLAFVAFLRPYL